MADGEEVPADQALLELAVQTRDAADAQVAAGQHRAAIDLYRSLFSAAKRASDQPVGVFALAQQSRVQRLAGDLDQALALVDQALDLHQEPEQISPPIDLLTDRGRILVERGDVDDGREVLARADRLAETAGDEARRAVTQFQLGLIAAQSGDDETAAAHYQRTEELAAQAGQRGTRARALDELASLDARRGETGRAERRWREAIDEWARDGRWTEVLQVLNDRAMSGEAPQPLVWSAQAAWLAPRVLSNPRDVAILYENLTTQLEAGTPVMHMLAVAVYAAVFDDPQRVLTEVEAERLMPMLEQVGVGLSSPEELSDWLSQTRFSEPEVLYPSFFEEIEALVPSGGWVFDRRLFSDTETWVRRGGIGPDGEVADRIRRVSALASRGSELGLTELAHDVNDSLLGWAERMNAPALGVAALVRQARVALDADDPNAALDFASQALAVATEHASPGEESVALTVRAQIELHVDDLGAAQASAGRALALADSDHLRAEAALMAARVARRLDDAAEAERHFEAAVTAASATGAHALAGIALLEHGVWAASRDEAGEALRLLSDAARSFALASRWDEVAQALLACGGVGAGRASVPYVAQMVWLSQRRSPDSSDVLAGLITLLSVADLASEVAPPLGIDALRIARSHSQDAETGEREQAAIGALSLAAAARGVDGAGVLDWIRDQAQEFAARPEGSTGELLESLVPAESWVFDRSTVAAASAPPRRSVPGAPTQLMSERGRELARRFVEKDSTREDRGSAQPRGFMARVRRRLSGF